MHDQELLERAHEVAQGGTVFDLLQISCDRSDVRAYVRSGKYEDALRHFDQIVFAEQMRGLTTAVSGWRANSLFNLCDGRAAFGEINEQATQDPITPPNLSKQKTKAKRLSAFSDSAGIASENLIKVT
ncbi:hypothetical protein OKW45_001931 [Paraburkholderia sp. WSM4175]|uniref:hypothetical protein n=1 Tax=Paraburkholderia sp. WSM4175 TaxID=2991072 RepID=UPI003D1C6038